MMNGRDNDLNSADHLFDQFVSAYTCKTILNTFQELCSVLGVTNADHTTFYKQLKSRLTSWKAVSLWSKLDKRASHRDYQKMQACTNTKVLVIGAGPCGLRIAIEVAFLGGRAVVVEKRDRFSRNNVLHLWPFLITDLKNLGAKKFFGKFCAGAIDHISIRQLQCILLKVALILGVEVHVNVSFDEILEPPKDQTTSVGWRCLVTPRDHPVSEYQYDVLICCDGKRNTIPGFPRKEFRGKIAIGITANFINRNTTAEAYVEEISGVAFIFNQKFFLDLKDKTGIGLENIVYYKDETHYFVMTAKKDSLLDKGVLKEDYGDAATLLSQSNVNHEALLAYAREAADFSTNHKLPALDYAVNHFGQPDVAMFDFTSMFAAENASRVIKRHNHKLLLGICGDSLLEPFWPTGSGCARGFLGVFDAAWMIKRWASNTTTPWHLIAERESILQLLSQTTPETLAKNHSQYSLDPNTRYPNLHLKRALKPIQVRHLYDGGDESELKELVDIPAKRARNNETIPQVINDSNIDSYTILRWCQKVLNTDQYRNVHIVDFTSSWRSGLAFCALIHAFRPSLIDFNQLIESEVAKNCQLAFDTAEKELAVSPVMSGEDMATSAIPDKLTIIAYLSQLFQIFKSEPLPTMRLPKPKVVSDEAPILRTPARKISFLHRLSSRLSKSKRKKEKEENEQNHIFVNKKLKETDVELTKYNKLPMEEIANKLMLDRKPAEIVSKDKDVQSAVNVTAMAEILASKFRGEDKVAPEPRKVPGILLAAQPASEFCAFCKKRVYIMERMSAEGVFFHRGCLKCDYCGTSLRLTTYACDRQPEGGGVKFYCFRHINPERRVKMKRKRILWDEDGSKENIPTIITVEAGPAAQEEIVSVKDKPRVTMPSPLSPLQVPDDTFDKINKTPERVEFENTFEGLEEESEEEQLEHNMRLSMSMSCDALLPNENGLDESDTDSDMPKMEVKSGGEDDVLFDPVDTGLNKSMTWEEAYQLASSLKLRHSQENLVDAVEKSDPSSSTYTRLKEEGVDNDDEDDTTEVEDSEYETDEESTEEGDTEEEGEEEEEDNSDEQEEDGNKDEMPQDRQQEQAELPSPLKSPSVSAMFAARANFFASPPEPVRIDAMHMFGLDKQKKMENDTATAASTEDVQMENKNLSNDDDHEKASAEESETSEGDDIDGEHHDTEETNDADIEDDLVSEEEEADLDKTAVSEAMQKLLVAMETKESLSNSDEDERVSSSRIEEDRESGRALDDTEREVLRSVENMNETEDTASGGESTLQQVLQSVLAMKDTVKGDEEDDKHAIEFKFIDETFVTDRRGRRKKKTRSRRSRSAGSDSSFTISTPSGSSLSSQSSLREEVAYNQHFLDSVGDEDDTRPDDDMLRDYTATMSMVLGEDQSESEKSDGKDVESMEVCDDRNDSTICEEKSELSEKDESSIYKTPSSSLMEEKHEKSVSDQSDVILSPEVVEEKSQDVLENKPSLLNGTPLAPVNKPDVCTPLFPKESESPKFSKKLELKNGKAENKKTKSVRKLPLKPNALQTESRRNVGRSGSSTTSESLSSPTFKHLSGVSVSSSVSSNPVFKDNDGANVKSSGSDSRETSASPTPFVPKPVPRTPKQNKTKISVDRNKFFSDSSSEQQGSDGSEVRRKRIPLDKSLLDKEPVVLNKPVADSMEDDMDIPFADESEVDETFYTPATSMKTKPQQPKEPANKNVRKRLLPTPPKDSTTPAVLSADQIREIRKSDLEKAKAKAREKVRLKSDEELGLQCMNRAYNAPASRVAKKVKTDERNRRSMSYSSADPQSSDTLADSDENRGQSTQTPISSTAETDYSSVGSKGKKKRQKTVTKTPKSKSKKSESKVEKSSGKSESDNQKKEKRKSLLSKLLSNKSPDKSAKEKNVSESPSDSSNQNSLTKKKKEPVSKSDKKKKKRKSHSTDLLDSSLSDNIKGLQIGSVFYTAENGVSKTPKKPSFRVPVAPKAEVDEFSDSGESMMSTSTLQMKRHGETDEHLARRLHRAAQKQQKLAEQKRLRSAQEIQRQLEEVDVKQRELENRGIVVEKALRGEGSDAIKEETRLMQEWFNLVHEKNALVRYESELMVRARELELEDRQARLQHELRESMQNEAGSKTEEQMTNEKRILDELLEVVEQRDSLVAMLDEDRLREQEEDKDLQDMMLKKGFELSPMSYTKGLGKFDTPPATEGTQDQMT
ncbi:F-actin-monooxygenase MICAL3-like isoform X2 [Gigantopelta aegis]|uniref:F-actin-monooxygenase MICAL3-like isoform X2 n=1 Tax=Gigantopelta aegis TaxID=1735272 RepID=UPI001B887AC8|nr:F-actin-monooxygenase MICAL3-like isoform X2 [Gigantopelta aegis]